ncbi:hypothetical protein HUK80_17760 [Flavobacterium sp. MAH-1]|uniref:Uncharacterized protein n=1 Tax=Flavobacterium agri TaxID=2743471 RepID=A0A7Y8Y586_9FLAO|nr:hypothetical protein [Flavobacterium agri]NUY82754.1 hypothetical protein [Flavobacterium agri]NYA72777.1 hypothetical protein [Flavobacterium agri]
MEPRKDLIVDIEKYLENAINVYNEKGIVEKPKYRSLRNRITSLIETDFESIEKHEYFLDYFNQPERRIRRVLLEKSLEDDYLESGAFLFLLNDLRGIANWLN